MAGMWRILGWLAAAALFIAALAFTAAHEPDPSAPGAPLVRPSNVKTSSPSNVKTVGPGYRAPASCRDTDRKNIPYGDPDYAPWLDGDGDGLACEIPQAK